MPHVYISDCKEKSSNKRKQHEKCTKIGQNCEDVFLWTGTIIKVGRYQFQQYQFQPAQLLLWTVCNKLYKCDINSSSSITVSDSSVPASEVSIWLLHDFSLNARKGFSATFSNNKYKLIKPNYYYYYNY